jgi:hypothetical protein
MYVLMAFIQYQTFIFWNLSLRNVSNYRSTQHHHGHDDIKSRAVVFSHHHHDVSSYDVTQFCQCFSRSVSVT